MDRQYALPCPSVKSVPKEFFTDFCFETKSVKDRMTDDRGQRTGA